jgi:N-acetylglucosamine-6-phosphate deacetylase
VIQFTNCRLVKHNKLVDEDLWISERTGRILNGQKVFYEYRVGPDQVIDLGGRIISPGLIDVQLNGGYGFDFSVAPQEISQYGKELARLNKSLIRTGVTSYLPTLTSQKSDVYHKVVSMDPFRSHKRS